MTFIGGYIYKNIAHIIADSAETFHLPYDFQNIKIQEKHRGSFGDLPYFNSEMNFLVGENANKIYNLRKKLLVTFAGITNEGEELVRQISYHLEKPSLESISKSVLSILLEEKPKQTHYIIGGIENKKAFLIYYFAQNRYGIITEPIGLTIGGTNAKGIGDPVAQTMQHIYKSNVLSSEESLILIQAVLQSYSLSQQTIKNHVGGFFNGVSISEEGISWTKDTCYVLYSTVNFYKGDKFTIYKFNRDDVVFMIGQFKRFYSTFQNNHLFSSIIKKWEKDFEYKINKIKSDYFVMLSYDKSTIVIVSNKKGKKNKVITTSMDGKTAIRFPKVIFENMFKYYPPPKYFVWTNFFD